MLNNLPTDLAISDLFTGDLQLATPPTLYFELQKIIEHPAKTIADTAAVIEKDASLSARLLKIVNSAFYGFPSKIVSIDRAINLIGTKELQNLVLGTIIVDRFSEIPEDLISMDDFWARNLRCALIAQEIDCYLGKKYADSVFVCAILHNIGQLVFFRRIPSLAKEVLLMLQADDKSEPLDEVLFERRVIGFDHYETGAELTRLWKLPEIICESIRLHAYPDDTGKYFEIAAIVRLADHYSKMDDFHEVPENTLHIPIDKMSEIIDKAFENFEKIFKAFYP